MQYCILLETRLLDTMPDTIKTVFDAGPLEIVVNDNVFETVCGNHVILSGNEADFNSWLTGQLVYVGHGCIMAQVFEGIVWEKE